MNTMHHRPPHRHGAVDDTAALGLTGVRAVQPREPPQATVARFLIDGQLRPPITDTLPVAEALRAALMSQFERGCRGTSHAAGVFQRRDRPERFASPVLAGKDADGQRVLGHAHAYYLPSAERQGGRIDHLTVHAAGGFGAAEAISARRCWGPARVWMSATPFVACRYPKCNGSKRNFALRSPRTLSQWSDSDAPILNGEARHAAEVANVAGYHRGALLQRDSRNAQVRFANAEFQGHELIEAELRRFRKARIVNWARKGTVSASLW